MSPVTGTDSSVLSTVGLTPQQQADLALLGGGASSSSSMATLAPSVDQTPTQQADAALVDLSVASTAPSVGTLLAQGATPSEAEASELVSSLASEITSSGSDAASVYSQLSAYAAYALTKP